MSSSIEFSGVSKTYGDQVVLGDINLSIPVDVTTALVGESGSGKSTLLMLINGLIQPDAGQVSVLGEYLDESRMVSLRRRMGYAVQGGGLFPHLTIAENVSLVARLSGWSLDQCNARLDELFSLLELDMAFKERYPHSLSGGQQQRVSLCRAMMMDPALLLLDEPFSALDPLTRSAIHAEFIKLQGVRSRSILLVTHDMSEATRLAQHIVILQEGAVVQEGSVQHVVEKPASDYVQKLLEAGQ